MAMRRLLRLLGGGRRPEARTATDGDAVDRDAGLRAEIETLGTCLAVIGAELGAVERAAALQAPDLIPESLRGPFVPPAGPRPRGPGAAPEPLHPPQGEEALRAERNHLEELVAMARAEREIFEELLGVLHPGLPWEEAGGRLRGLCLRAFDLSGFYLARVDEAAGLIRFPFFYEAGRPGRAEPIPFAPSSGLTGWALSEGVPCCLGSREACEARGMRLTGPELRSGLRTQSWFGVPLTSPGQPRPRGLMAFHCYHPDAFPPDRQRIMTTLARLTGVFLG